jgi:hypothetical protein
LRSYSYDVESWDGTWRRAVVVLRGGMIRESVWYLWNTLRDWWAVEERTQTITLPTLTTYSLPFSLPLINITFTLPTTLILHLNENEDGEIDDADDAALHTDDEGVDEADDGELKVDGERERRLVVTKWEEKSVLDSVLAKSRLLSSLYVPSLDISSVTDISNTATQPSSSPWSPPYSSSSPPRSSSTAHTA